MPRVVAYAVVRGETPEVFIAEDEATLNWVLALRLIAQTRGDSLPTGIRDDLRDALREERWGDAVALWMQDSAIDIYPSTSLFTASDVELGAQELEFTPLFED